MLSFPASGLQNQSTCPCGEASYVTEGRPGCPFRGYQAYSALLLPFFFQPAMPLSLHPRLLEGKDAFIVASRPENSIQPLHTLQRGAWIHRMLTLGFSMGFSWRGRGTASLRSALQFVAAHGASPLPLRAISSQQ